MERELTQDEIEDIAPDFIRAREFSRNHLNVELTMRCWENMETGEYRWIFKVYGHQEHTEYVLEHLRESADQIGLVHS